MTALATDNRTTPVHTASGPFDRGLAWLYLVGGLIGLAAAIALTLEKIAKLHDPGYVPSCSLNPVISCGSVMDSPQAAAFGFPNPLIGLSAFTVVVTIGVVLLCGFGPPRWLWLGMQVGVSFGAVFVHWLINASLYDIHALCPYCMVVWAVTIPLFWYTTLHNLDRGYLPGGNSGATGVLMRFHGVVVSLWFVLIIILILQAFWTYWITLI